MQKNQQLISGIYTATNGNGMMADNGLGGSSVTHIDSPGINRIFTIANNSTDEMLFNTLSYAFVKQREFRVLIINDIITAVWFNDVAEPTPALSIPDFKFRVQKFTSIYASSVHRPMAYDDSVGWIPIQDGTEVKNMYTLVNNAFFENKAVQFDVYNGYITDTQYYIPRENPDTKF